jgi:hypothetical protein
MGDSPFRTWNDVPAHEFRDGVHLHAIGGEQVCLCRATYAPGKQVPLHAHEHTEQVMVIRGIEHSLYSEPGVTFLEALAPVPLDHIPDRQRDLVLGPDGGAMHVEQ